MPDEFRYMEGQLASFMMGFVVGYIMAITAGILMGCIP